MPIQILCVCTICVPHHHFVFQPLIVYCSIKCDGRIVKKMTRKKASQRRRFMSETHMGDGDGTSHGKIHSNNEHDVDNFEEDRTISDHFAPEPQSEIITKRIGALGEKRSATNFNSSEINNLLFTYVYFVITSCDIDRNIAYSVRCICVLYSRRWRITKIPEWCIFA